MALVAATVVPAAPLRRPREQAAVVVRKVADLLRAAADVMVDGEVEPALDLLADARSTDYLIRELQLAADEGLAVVASSPFRVRHRPGVRRMAELVDPLDRALRSTRVLVRHTAVAAYHRRPVPHAYAVLARELADAVDEVAEELHADRMAVDARPALLAVGFATGQVERSAVLSAEVVLAQLRGVIADMLLLTGLDSLEASDALPPPPGHRRRDRPALGAPRRPRPVPGGGGGAAPARAGRAAGGGRRPRGGHRAGGGLDRVVRGAGVRDPVGDAAADGPQEVPRRGVPAGRLPGLRGGLGAR